MSSEECNWIVFAENRKSEKREILACAVGVENMSICLRALRKAYRWRWRYYIYAALSVDFYEEDEHSLVEQSEQ